MGQRAAVKNEHSFKLQRNRCESAAGRRRQGSPAQPPEHGQDLKLQSVLLTVLLPPHGTLRARPPRPLPGEDTERPRPKVWGAAEGSWGMGIKRARAGRGEGEGGCLLSPANVGDVLSETS